MRKIKKLGILLRSNRIFSLKKLGMERKERKQYIFTILFTLAAFVIMLAYNFYTFYSNAVSNMIEVGESSLAQETEQLDSYLVKGMDVLQVTAITVEYMMGHGASSEDIQKFLVEESDRYKQDIDENFTGIYGVFRGDYLDGSEWIPDEGYIPEEREWYIAASRAGGRPTIVSPYLDAKTGTIMISVSQLLYDYTSVISLDIVLEQMQIITENIDMGGMGYGFIVDREGLVVAHHNKEEKGKNYLDDEEMVSLLKRVYIEDKKIFNTKIRGEEYTIFTNSVMDDWYVVMVISNTRLYREIRNILLRNIIISFIVFVLISYFCTLAFRKVVIHMRNAEESKSKMEKMNVTLMQTLARTIDAKDRYTNGHSMRVAKYTVEIAKRLGKSEEEQKDMYYAALLHDVGKIHIPDAIINKPVRLTEEEFAYVKLHPVSGYYILRDIEENPLIAQCAKWHHERFDGNGYPNGLSGKDIPEAVRIIGVADAYDAMTSNRSYRQVMPQSQVREEFEKGKGVQFDPEIADVMLAMIDDDKDYSMHQVELIKSILVVDDEQSNLDLVEKILKHEPGYTVYKESTGKGALKLLEEKQIDLILLDIQMPEMDGFEVYSKIREISSIPIVFLTENKDIDIINTVNTLCAEDYLIKPFMPQALLEILHSVLQESIASY